MAGNIYWKKGHYSMIEFMSQPGLEEWSLEMIGERAASGSGRR